MLRRWPEQTGAVLGQRCDAKEAGAEPASKAFPTIASAVLEISGIHQSVAADPRTTGARLKVTLPAGRTTLKAWFQDESGKDLCGAFFVTVNPTGK